MAKTFLYRFFLLLIIVVAGISSANATHNRAGEIIYTQIGDLTIRATIITYTKTSSIDADRDSLELFWGDGTSQFVYRSNGTGQPLENDIKLNYYIAEHTYPARSTYTMHFTDANRVANILNVNAPNSIEIPFYVETTFTFLNSQFQGTNSSVQLLKEPIEFACVGQRFIHNPNAYDPDNDSIAYSFIVPQEGVDTDVPKYKYPDEIVPGAINQISLDPITGDFVWETPQIVGEYNIAIKIDEYRNGILIGSVIRDMQIFVSDCDNSPPKIESIDEICIVAGEILTIPLTIDDPDEGQQVKISATGGPFIQEYSPAFLDIEEEYQDPVVNGNFIWQTTCEHISDTYYTIVVRAIDNFFAEDIGLTDLKTIRIKIVGPSPDNLASETVDQSIRLTWDSPYFCEDAEDNYFQGFSVWRKVKSNQFPIDTCNPGLESKGYTRIAPIVNDRELDSYFYVDSDISKGNTYCYRVQAEFAKISSQGFPYNQVPSLPSNETCGILLRDIPLITKVSVLSTDTNNGSIEVEWIKPKVPDLDTLQFPGPYRYKLVRGVGFNPTEYSPVPNGEITTQSFGESVDLSIVDSGLETAITPYNYIVEFYTGNNPEAYGTSSNASSIYLNTQPNDMVMNLDWDETVPWENSEYTIYRQIEGGAFDSISTTTNKNYKDTGLENGVEYCYYIRSKGSYGIDDIPGPLFNLSQISCSSPVDSMPPCVPILEITNLCDNADLITDDGRFINLLSWREPIPGCLSDSDTESFNIYFSVDSLEFELIEEIDINDGLSFKHILESTVAGCYRITSIDSSGNESDFSDIICSSNCPLYELPNAFTPNGDGSNDLYVPRQSRFVSSVDMKVFNRWGELVFETTDPQINWDGTNLRGNNLADGVYYYKCLVQESIIGGAPGGGIGQLNGTIHLIRSN